MAEHDDQMLEYYAAPGRMTDLTDVPPDVFDGLPTDPVGLCRTVQGLVVHEMWASAYEFDVPESRLTDLQARSAVEMTDVIRRLHPGPLSAARPAEQRMVGNCRHFSTLSCALVRRAGIPARARCGFGMYFEPGK
ncbi:MAG: transglutaminase domain-containing protein, partial [Acidimicrobiia bacterium]